jgi:threonine/homoserine/homoserine lactone efflux protein
MGGILATAVVYGLAAGLMPGPMLMVAIAQTLRHGLREGLKIAFCPILTDAPRIALLLVIVPRLQTFTRTVALIGLAGAAYLVWLAVDTWRSRPPEVEAAAAEAPRSWQRGIVTNLVNPNPWLFWVTVGTPLLVRARQLGAAAPAAFIVLFFVCLIGSFGAFVVVIARYRDRMVYHAYRAVMRLLSLLLIVFAAMNGRDAVALLRT